MRFRAVAVAGAAALLVPSLLAASGTPAAFASSPHCTIKGTAHADHLTGTRRADVICGLGGNDTIVGRGGNDIVRGGTGSDSLTGSTGSDTLVGGSGTDRLYGGAGADSISGGLNADVATGGDGADDLAGGAGNDDLTGGPGSDDIDGGTGTNWCFVDDADVQHRCVYDTEPAVADAATVSAGSVDVTNGPQQVTVKAHLTDDTGVTMASVRPAEGDPDSYPSENLQLVSGNVRDGWWQGTLTFDRWLEPDTYHLRISMSDRVFRWSDSDLAEPAIQVLDAKPDLVLPEVTLISPKPTDTFDVRTAEADVTIKARVTDALSGVARVSGCLHEPLLNGAEVYASCASLRLRSGDRHDGIYTGVVPILRKQTGGDWNVGINAVDRAHVDGSGMSYLGPDEYRIADDPTHTRPFPEGLGRFTVLGPSRGDTVAPNVSSVTVDPSHVDTLTGDALVHVTVKAADSGTGIDLVNVNLVPASYDQDNPSNPNDSGMELVAGTANDGTWSGSIRIPQGTPPQTYYLQVIVWDAAMHVHTYVSSGSPQAAVYESLPTNPMVTIDDTTP